MSKVVRRPHDTKNHGKADRPGTPPLRFRFPSQPDPCSLRYARCIALTTETGGGRL